MKNRSKKLSLLAILAVAAVSLASCGKKPEEIKLTETETQTETKATEAVTEAPTEAVTEAQTEPQTEPQPTYKTANGTIQEVTPDSITIYSRKGRMLTFNTAGKEIYLQNGLNAENEVQVQYEGEITSDDESASSVVVTAVVDGDKNAANNITVEAVSQTVYTLDDVNVRAEASTTGAILGGIPKGHALQQTGKVGTDWIQISYAGREAYVYAENITTNEAEAPESEMGLDDYSESDKIKTVSGTITSVDLGSMNILSDNGNDLYFNIYSASIHLVNGLNIGNYVTIEYNGDISDDNDTSMIWIISVPDAAAQTGTAAPGEPEALSAAKESEITAETQAAGTETGIQTGETQAAADMTTIQGTVQDATQNSVTIQTDDGSTLIFAYEGATMELADGLQVGKKISVTYNPANVYESGVHDAVTITDAQ